MSHNNCTRCGLCRLSRRVVGEGALPCDLLIVGEAPGKSEDVIGKPFVGPSGRILRCALEECRKKYRTRVRLYITNTVQCRPCDKKTAPNREPTKREICACKENLLAVYDEANPFYVLLLGEVARRNCSDIFPAALRAAHPASVVRAGGIGSSAYNTFLRHMENTYEKVIAAIQSED